MKNTLNLIWKIALLSVLYLILFIIGSAVLGPKISQNASNASAALATMPVVALVDTLVLTVVIMKSNWTGWRLILATMISYYGVQTFLAQIESAYFGPALGIQPSWLPGLFMSSLPIVLIFIPLAVLILGKARAQKPTEDQAAAERLNMPVAQWAWKLAVIAVIYVGLYFGFGFFVAWQNPHLVAMYGNGSNAQIFDNAKLIPLQFVRGILWTLFTLPVIRMTKANPWMIGLIVGLYLALPMNISHIIPNSIMPDPSVRLSHFIETASSNFIFGVILTQIILWKPVRSLQAGLSRERAKA